MEVINAVSCIKGEIHSIVTLMRLNTRWSQQGRLSDGVSTNTSDENPMIRSFRKLNEYLEGMFDLREVDCVMYLSPFYHVIISEKASGTLTSACLSSVSKFVTYGFLSPHFPRAREGIALIARCVSHCVFEESDWESDEVILMKLLELSTLCLRCDASRLLNVRAAWEIYSTCISVQSQYRASKILRSESETALRNLTLMTFGRAHTSLKIYSKAEKDDKDNEFLNLEVGSDFGLFVDVLGNSWDNLSESYDFDGPAGVTLLLGKIMTVFSSLMDSSTRTADGVKSALTLVNIALEAGGPSLGTVAPLVDVLRGDVCRHLLRASQSDDLAVFSLALRVVFNLFVSIKNHMKVQLEVFLTSVHLRILAPSILPLHGVKGGKSTIALPLHTASLAKEELALESLLEFCREPSLMEDLYTNYDCDVQCTNLFDSIISVLCVRATPQNNQKSSAKNSSNIAPKGAGHNFEPPSLTVSPTNGNSVRVSILNKVALDGVFAVLHSIAVKCEIAHNSKKGLRNVTKLLKAEAADTANLSDAGCDTKDLSDSRISSSPNKTNAVIVADHLVDQWCHEEDSGGLKNSESMSNIAESALMTDNSRATPSEPDRISDKRDVDMLTAAALSAHNQISDSGGDRTTICLSLPASTASTPRASQMVLRDANSSPFSAIVSTDGRQDFLTAADDDADFFLLARAKTAEVLRQRKFKKQRLRLAADKFNEKPLKPDWVHFALSLGLVRPAAFLSRDRANSDKKVEDKDKERVREKGKEKPKTVDQFAFADADSVAKFLKNTPGLGKTQVGEFLSKGPKEIYPYNAEVMRLYVDTFDFGAGTKCSFDKALRQFLGSFRLPGEAQCIDRLMESFAQKLFRDLGPGNPFASGDAAFILAFSTIMLNTDLHNPNLPHAKRMTREQFLRNNAGINDGKDLPKEYLDRLYDDIKSDEIKMDIDINDSVGAALVFTDSALWNKMLRKSTQDQVPASFTPTTSARLHFHSMTRYKTSELNPYPVGAHEKDMFIATATPVLGALLSVWELTDEDQMIRRITEGLWTYACVCIGFNLKNILNNLVFNLTSRVQISLNSSRNAASQAMAIESSVSEVYKARIINLTNLLNLPFESLISGNTSEVDNSAPCEETSCTPSSSGTEEVKMNWRETHRLRGEVMLRLVFHIAARCTSFLSADSWEAITKLMLYVRSRGVLPVQLASLALDFKNPLGSAFQFNHSEAALDCHFAARGAPRNLSASLNDAIDGDFAPSFLWGSVYSVASLGGILFQDNPNMGVSGSDKESEGRRDIILDGNSCLFTSRNAAMDFPNAAPAMSKNVGYAFDNLLRISMAASHVDVLLFRMIVEVDGAEYTSIITAQLGLLKGLVDELLTSTVVSNVIISKSHPQYKQYLNALSCTGNKEVDAVVLLGWISRIITANKARVHLVWPKMHAFYREMVEEKVDTAHVKCPYFLEHCIMMILKLVSLIAPSSSDREREREKEKYINSLSVSIGSDIQNKSDKMQYTSSSNGGIRTASEVQGPWGSIPWGTGLASPVAMTPSAVHSGLQSVWLSLRLTRGLPSEILNPLSDRIGAGILGILSSHGPSCVGISSLEQWYLVFSFISLAASTTAGRPFAWEAVRYLMGSDAINDMNFTPCRHLILRFLQGSFPSEESNEGRCDLQSWVRSAPSTTSFATDDTGMHQRQEEALSLLEVLNAMAMSGYKVNEDLHPKGKEDGTLDLEVPNLQNGPTLNSSAAPAHDVTQGVQSDPHRSAFQFLKRSGPVPGTSSSSSIHFAKPHEVEMLWLETVKVFADVCGNTHKPLAEKALISLKATLLAGEAASLPDNTWSRAVGELLTRLPLAIACTPHRRDKDGIWSTVHSLRCCKSLFELFVAHITELYTSPDFRAYWCKLTSLLSSNVGALEVGSDQYEEVVNMTISLYKLLKPKPFKKLVQKSVSTDTALAPLQLPSSIKPIPTLTPTPTVSSGVFGLFSIWGRTAAPVADKPSPSPEPGSTDSVTTSEITPSGDAADSVSDDMEEVSLDLASPRHDGVLLSLSWRNSLHITPSLRVAFRERDPALLSDLNRCCENPGTFDTEALTSSSLHADATATASHFSSSFATLHPSVPFNPNTRNPQVADILAKKIVPVTSSVMRPIGSLDLGLTARQNTSSPSSSTTATTEDLVSPQVQPGFISNGDRVQRNQNIPLKIPAGSSTERTDNIASSSSSVRSTALDDALQLRVGTSSVECTPEAPEVSSASGTEGGRGHSDITTAAQDLLTSQHSDRVKAFPHLLTAKAEMKGVDIAHDRGRGVDFSDAAVRVSKRDEADGTDRDALIDSDYTAASEDHRSSSSLGASEVKHVMVMNQPRASSRAINERIQIV